jgi:hypothetical protein
MAAAGYLTRDGGNTWTNVHYGSGDGWISCSADGETLFAVQYTGYGAAVSHDRGATWKLVDSGEIGFSFCSSDGQRLMYEFPYAGYKISSDGGNTWPGSNPSPLDRFISLAAGSADLCKMVGFTYVTNTVYTSQVTPSPNLKLTVSGAGAALSWPVPSTNFTLMQNSDLGTTNWAPVGSSPNLNLSNLEYQVVLPATGTNFYRLSTGN